MKLFIQKDKSTMGAGNATFKEIIFAILREIDEDTEAVEIKITTKEKQTE